VAAQKYNKKKRKRYSSHPVIRTNLLIVSRRSRQLTLSGRTIKSIKLTSDMSMLLEVCHVESTMGQ